MTDNKPVANPQKTDRIAAIREKAAELRERLETEACRLGLNLHPAAQGQAGVSTGVTAPGDHATFSGVLPGLWDV